MHPTTKKPPGEEDLLCLTSKTEEQQDIQETIETYARASPHGGTEQVRVQEMPDDEQDKKAKEFIDTIRKNKENYHICHMLNGDDLEITNPTGLEIPEHIKGLSI